MYLTEEAEIASNTFINFVDAASFTGCYAFGMLMPGRSFNASESDHGFHGMHKVDEVKGIGNHYTTLFREYDPRVGRWWSIDPAMSKYAGWSPYNFNFNNPVNLTDPDGDDSHKEKGEKVAKTATDKADNEQDRKYGAEAPCVDCSMFTQEVAKENEYSIPRVASDQEKYFKEKGEYSTDLKDAKVGDHAFWDRGNGNRHTAIVTKIDDDGNVYVTHSTVNKSQPGSIKKNQKLNSDGTIPYWGQKFVGVGRPKIEKTNSEQVAQKQVTYGPVNLEPVTIEGEGIPPPQRYKTLLDASFH